MFGYCIYECGVIYIALDGGECCGCVWGVGAILSLWGGREIWIDVDEGGVVVCVV